ncbi:MAG: hypothetical protein LUD22_02755 [Coprobacillus sp.]|nr:hypothetical protein [Coprobacillus sp.]
MIGVHGGMYEVNTVVMHKREGLCTINGIVDMGGKKYFQLNAKRGEGDNIYVPVETADGIIRPLMSKEVANSILLYMRDLSDEIIANTKQRRDYFKKKLLSGNVEDIVYLAKQLYLYNTEKDLPADVHFGSIDIELLEQATNILFDEFEYIFNLNREGIYDYINQILSSTK